MPHEGVFLIGLTGSIGMGKSTCAEMFAALGIAVFDADAAVHTLYAPGGAAIGPVGDVFPEAIIKGGIDRAALARTLAGDESAFAKLEAIVHPLVAASRESFIRAVALRGGKLAVLNIPLLFEVGDHTQMDAVVVVSAPFSVQQSRVLSRPGMTKERFEQILSRQWPDARKRQMADFIIDTGAGYERSFAEVRRIVDVLRKRAEGG